MLVVTPTKEKFNGSISLILCPLDCLQFLYMVSCFYINWLIFEKQKGGYWLDGWLWGANMIDARSISSSVIVWLVDSLELEVVRDVQSVNQILLLRCMT